jgi:hypothetical protein
MTEFSGFLQRDDKLQWEGNVEELIKAKGKELMQIYWNDSEDIQPTAHARRLARHVLICELQARLEELKKIFKYCERIQELENQIKELS